jgi:hypothetical protein
VTLFLSAFPLTPCLALLNDKLEIRVDSFKLCKLCCNPVNFSRGFGRETWSASRVYLIFFSKAVRLSSARSGCTSPQQTTAWCRTSVLATSARSGSSSSSCKWWETTLWSSSCHFGAHRATLELIVPTIMGKINLTRDFALTIYYQAASGRERQPASLSARGSVDADFQPHFDESSHRAFVWYVRGVGTLAARSHTLRVWTP